MPSKLHYLTVIDIESSCWSGKPPEGEYSEIIEIGGCLLNLYTLEISDKIDIIVKPIKSHISEYCTKLTTLTQETVNAGISFNDACELLADSLKTKNKLWTSWGDYDRVTFYEQCRAFKVPYPFSLRHINAKTLHALYRGLKQEVGMSKALALEQMELLGTHHRAVDDAWNTARILVKIFGEWHKGASFK